MKTAIIIPCYNRPNSLKRLLKSISEANYTTKVDIIFSIDYSGKLDVYKVASNFKWEFGEKKIIQYNKNIGLKANILSCGDLTEEYDAVILLEDDLVVSPAFFQYVTEAAKFYDGENRIAGISLYSYDVCETGYFRFYPIRDEYDTFFIQWPSSWGQLWTRQQWKMFRSWLKQGIPLDNINIPDHVKNWTHSWKKYFIAYMVDCDKYFVYPYQSFTNEMGKGGIHHSMNNSVYSVNLYQGKGVRYQFRKFTSEAFTYDCFFQPKDSIIIVNDKRYEVSFDFYATKLRHNIKKQFLITSRKVNKNSDCLESFPNICIPMEMNLKLRGEGFFFVLAHIDSIEFHSLSPSEKLSLRMPLSPTEMILYIKEKIINKFKRTLQ